MKPDKLAGQWVWVEVGMPVLFRSDDRGSARVRHDRVVRIDRVQPATPTTPALAIWSDAEGSYGVDVDLVRSAVMSLPPSGNSPLADVADAARRLIRRSDDD